jgi:hypothetical protein
MSWVASLIGTLENTETLPAILQHLRHERKILQPAKLIESREDLLAGSDLNPLPGF